MRGIRCWSVHRLVHGSCEPSAAALLVLMSCKCESNLLRSTAVPVVSEAGPQTRHPQDKLRAARCRLWQRPRLPADATAASVALAPVFDASSYCSSGLSRLGMSTRTSYGFLGCHDSYRSGNWFSSSSPGDDPLPSAELPAPFPLPLASCVAPRMSATRHHPPLRCASAWTSHTRHGQSRHATRECRHNMACLCCGFSGRGPWVLQLPSLIIPAIALHKWRREACHARL